MQEEIYEQLTISDYLAGMWTPLEPAKGVYRFPEYSAEWKLVECRVYYPKINKESTELYEYKDFTFRSVEKWNPQMGHGKITAWREYEEKDSTGAGN